MFLPLIWMIKKNSGTSCQFISFITAAVIKGFKESVI